MGSVFEPVKAADSYRQFRLNAEHPTSNAQSRIGDGDPPLRSIFGVSESRYTRRVAWSRCARLTRLPREKCWRKEDASADKHRSGTRALRKSQTAAHAEPSAVFGSNHRPR